jgi:hypothetical protein
MKDLRASLERWMARARAAGLDDASIAELFSDTLRPPTVSRVA